MPMPYTLSKGTLFTLLENTLNPKSATERSTRNGYLANLRQGGPITSISWVSTGPGSGVTLPGGPLSLRLDRDWFGRSPNSAGGWDEQPAYTGQTTGYWVGYYGDVEAVLRQALIRAVEVSLGVAHGASADEATREWPIEIHWKCPNPYFEAWVAWRQRGTGQNEGQVNLTICTPPDTNNRLVVKPEYPPPVPGQTPVATPLSSPVRADGPVGLWLVAHREHRQHTVDQLVDVRDGSPIDVLLDQVAALAGLPKRHWLIPMPTTFWEDDGDGDDVVVVAPPNYAGGVDPTRTNAL